MLRATRVKDPEAIYHVMARSIDEFNMFPGEEDKNYFLDLLKTCKEKYCCRIYAYSVMTNHFHILLDTNGYDVSKFMKSLNQRYLLRDKKPEEIIKILAEKYG